MIDVWRLPYLAAYKTASWQLLNWPSCFNSLWLGTILHIKMYSLWSWQIPRWTTRLPKMVVEPQQHNISECKRSFSTSLTEASDCVSNIWDQIYIFHKTPFINLLDYKTKAGHTRNKLGQVPDEPAKSCVKDGPVVTLLSDILQNGNQRSRMEHFRLNRGYIQSEMASVLVFCRHQLSEYKRQQ